jgi:tRNA A-37 threonylcarbamoyl transferase component Bud32
MNTPLHWLAGDETLRAAVEAAIEHERPEAVLVETPRRRVVRVQTPDPARPLVLKHFLARAPGARDRVKRALGHSSAAREWRALGALAAQGLPAPAPRAHARRGDEEWVAMDFVAGRPIAEVLPAAAGADRRALVEELGLILRRLRIAGIAHGDLHLDNVLLDEDDGPVLVDWQRARLTRSSRAHARDLASLEFALVRTGLPRSDRLRLRRAALGTAASRAAVLAAGERVDAFAHDHYRGRTRRARTPGSQHTRVHPALGSGMRARDFGDETVREACASHAQLLAASGAAHGEVLKDDVRARVTRFRIDGRPVVAKEVTKAGLGRRLADPLRGSPAERGWIGGLGLLARRIGVARPLAWLAAGGSRGGSILFMADVAEHRCLETTAPGAIDPDVLLRLLLGLHRRGVDHGDLQASHVYGVASGAPMLIDLEGVRFRRRLDDDARLRALAELNASLPETSLAASQRLELFRRYATALPFAMPRERALRELVRRSLDRRHAWQARDC